MLWTSSKNVISLSIVKLLRCDLQPEIEAMGIYWSTQDRHFRLPVSADKVARHFFQECDLIIDNSLAALQKTPARGARGRALHC